MKGVMIACRMGRHGPHRRGVGKEFLPCACPCHKGKDDVAIGALPSAPPPTLDAKAARKLP